MARERECYRDNLEMLVERFGDGAAVLPLEEIKPLIGTKDIRAMKNDKRLLECGFKKVCGRWKISVAGLARYLS